METKKLNKEIQIFILKILNKQFMYSEEIIERCIDEYKDKISSPNPSLAIKNQIKNLSDAKLVPIRPKPVITSSKMRRIPLSSQISRSLSK